MKKLSTNRARFARAQVLRGTCTESIQYIQHNTLRHVPRRNQRRLQIAQDPKGSQIDANGIGNRLETQMTGNPLGSQAISDD